MNRRTDRFFSLEEKIPHLLRVLRGEIHAVALAVDPVRVALRGVHDGANVVQDQVVVAAGKNPATANTPVVLMTADEDLGDSIQAELDSFPTTLEAFLSSEALSPQPSEFPFPILILTLTRLLSPEGLRRI